MTDGGLDFQRGANLGGSGPHITESEAFIFVEGNAGNPGTIVFYVKNEVWCVPFKTHVNRGWISVPYGVVDRLLGDAY